jgi:hypothetical protein
VDGNNAKSVKTTSGYMHRSDTLFCGKRMLDIGIINVIYENE